MSTARPAPTTLVPDTDRPMQTCRRCQGRGTVANGFMGGICFSCEGRGRVRPLKRVVVDTRMPDDDYTYGVACRMDREFDRKARRAAKGA